MNACIKAALIVMITMLVFSAQTAPEITANGLFPGKAVLTIDGKQVFLSLGQTRYGVRLIRADEDHAVIEVDGRQQTLHLDKSIAKEYSTAEQFKRYSESKSHVINAKIIHQTGNLVTFEVDYFFTENLGERANLIAKTLSRGELTDYWAHTYTPLEHGRNSTNITVAMNEKAPERYVSDQMLFEILWTRKDKSGTTGAYVMEFIKQWER
jgi:rRNA maturation protein Rpf1